MGDQTLCVQCHTALAIKDWTCPRCGAIVDRFLFSTINLKSLKGESRNSYQAGYAACEEQVRQTGSTTIGLGCYHPTTDYEKEYRAGWQIAADKVNAKADRKFGRRRGVRVLGGGVVSLLAGIGITVGVHILTRGLITHIVVDLTGLGVVGIVIGLTMIVTGENDDARPDS